MAQQQLNSSFKFMGLIMNRIHVLLALVIVVVLGLASRAYPWLFPAALDKYPGDALWAMAVYLGLKILAPLSAPLRLGVAALSLSFVVEWSQLYHVAWLDALRSHFIGHLFLGSTFNVIDLLAYSVGIALIVSIDSLYIKCCHCLARPK